jgi:hypothetical protein
MQDPKLYKIFLCMKPIKRLWPKCWYSNRVVHCSLVTNVLFKRGHAYSNPTRAFAEMLACFRRLQRRMETQLPKTQVRNKWTYFKRFNLQWFLKLILTTLCVTRNWIHSRKSDIANLCCQKNSHPHLSMLLTRMIRQRHFGHLGHHQCPVIWNSEYICTV